MIRCELSDLPVDQCACRVHGPADPPGVYQLCWPEDVVVTRFKALFRSTLDCGHRAIRGGSDRSHPRR